MNVGRMVVALAAIASITWAASAFAGVVGVPEIDPGMATGGIGLLVASVLLIRERYRGR